MRIFWSLVLATIANVAQAQNAELAASVVDEQGRPLADAIVVAVPADGSLRLPARPRDGVVDQVNKEFTPKVTAIVVGTPVTFPNNDNVRHQVYSFSPAKRFELPLYAGVPAQPVLFDKPGVIVLGCNIHDWMVGYVYVSESPYFAKTGSDGKALLADLPPRPYVVRVWHPQLDASEESTRQNVDASSAGRLAVTWTLKLKPEVKVRRAPTAERSGRY
ncbi:MAG TPA: methylamine utilization protein [Casimicrobiaceae bacterium]|nr:methylamine utilization protein [Casimicrobiaceae bacterium]